MRPRPRKKRRSARERQRELERYNDTMRGLVSVEALALPSPTLCLIIPCVPNIPHLSSTILCTWYTTQEKLFRLLLIFHSWEIPIRLPRPSPKIPSSSSVPPHTVSLWTSPTPLSALNRLRGEYLLPRHNYLFLFLFLPWDCEFLEGKNHVGSPLNSQCLL